MTYKTIGWGLVTAMVLWLTPGYSLAMEVDPYDQLLKTHVSQGEKKGITTSLVDYEAWGRDARHAQAMQTVLNTDPDTLAGDALMAFWINAYNLLTIDLIIQKNEKNSIRNLGGFFTSPWKAHHWVVNGKKVTLDEIEHHILRPMGDARIHMAINCASLSCPDLRAEAYTADTLDQQLDEQSRFFLDNPQKGVKIKKDRVKVSMIFKWFREDFDNGAVGFIRAYQTLDDAAAKRVDYLPYNWDLNSSSSE